MLAPGVRKVNKSSEASKNRQNNTNLVGYFGGRHQLLVE